MSPLSNVREPLRECVYVCLCVCVCVCISMCMYVHVCERVPIFAYTCSQVATILIRKSRCCTLWSWHTFSRPKFWNFAISETIIASTKIRAIIFYRCWYSTANGITMNVVLSYLDLNVQDKNVWCNFYRSCYSSSNGITANVALHDPWPEFSW